MGVRTMKKIASLFIILCLAFTINSCATATKQQKGTAVGAGVGAGVGAVLGQAIGGDTGSTLIGAGIGAVVGGIAGNQIGAYMDRQEQELREALAESEAASIRRTQEAIAASEAVNEQRTIDVLTATFKSEILFDFDSSVLKPGSHDELRRVANVLNKYPQTTITVEGHTDSTGSEAYNQELSERRALAVEDALMQMNVDPGRMQAVGFGESKPVYSVDAMNRRVNIVIRPIIRGSG
jgi:outer membrane protein OmpA-like peptidoglycan-associated protein